MKMRELELEREGFVADIEDKAISGVDIIQKGKHGPADILLSKKTYHFG